MQEMGETREPMARDCWYAAQELAQKYARSFDHDFWILYAAKPHVKQHNAIVAAWDVIAKRPPAAMVGVLVFKWDHKDRELRMETDLSLPYDVPLSESELSSRKEDVVPTLGEAAKKSGSILLA